jgi:hypothetical protein
MTETFSFHQDGTVPLDEDTIWVFGSNLAGRHGAGAAKIALEMFGAMEGVGRGLVGHSYAIPTKSHPWHTLDIKEIEGHVVEFLTLAAWHDVRPFFITRIGCGLAGFSDSQIAPLFRGATPNCSFAEEWRQYLTI